MATTYPQLNVVIPDKKPKGGELTEDPKGLNFLKASMRVVVEHAIGGVKRLNVIAHTYRNRTEILADPFMVVACRLWNYHLERAKSNHKRTGVLRLSALLFRDKPNKGKRYIGNVPSKFTRYKIK